ncbi:hypothetical protein [Pseudaestuariivita atlantica]|uniref:hypothetical protein n=1 Tax=Pseudaestuariivita atlantica TaxID=1317121 RepID=UPI00106B2064|nr:hypothetical protein [Pseudaestuariivita atlantica]
MDRTHAKCWPNEFQMILSAVENEAVEAVGVMRSTIFGGSGTLSDLFLTDGNGHQETALHLRRLKAKPPRNRRASPGPAICLTTARSMPLFRILPT